MCRPIFNIILFVPFVKSTNSSLESTVGSIWPGQQEVDDACGKDAFGENLSGMYLYDDARQAWAIQNTGFLYKLNFIEGDLVV